jgi:hypothetical protein
VSNKSMVSYGIFDEDGTIAWALVRPVVAGRGLPAWSRIDLAIGSDRLIDGVIAGVRASGIELSI